MADAGIIRDRAKIEATIKNARPFLAVARRTGGLRPFLWQFVGGAPKIQPVEGRGCPRGEPGVQGDEQGAQAPRLRLRRSHDLLRVHAGGRHGGRPRRDLLPAAGEEGPCPTKVSAFRTDYRYRAEILQNMGCTRFWILYIFSPRSSCPWEPFMIRTSRCVLLVLLNLLAALTPLFSFQDSHQHMGSPPLPSGTPPSGEAVIDVPPVDAGADTLEARGAAERASVPRFKVDHDFRFTDRLPESGITFLNQIVDDAGKNYKAAHYDHGNGIAVADVDGDGLPDIYFVSQLGGNQLWKNLGDGKFKNITAEAGVGRHRQDLRRRRPSPTSTTTAIQDLYVTTVRGGNMLFENDGRAVPDITQKSGLGLRRPLLGGGLLRLRPRRLARPVCWCNVGPVHDREAATGGLLRRLRGRLSRATCTPSAPSTACSTTTRAGTLRRRLRRGCTIPAGAATRSSCDFNGDGWPDLYVLNMQGDNHYCENEGGKRFVDKTASTSPRPPGAPWGSRCSTSTTTAARPLVTDMHSDMVG